MATILLADAKKLGLDDLSAGVAETVSTLDDFFAILPFNTTYGNSYSFNRIATHGNVGAKAIGGSTSDVKTQVTFAQKNLALSAIMGDAEVDRQLIAQGVGANAGNDPVSASINSKAYQIGREFQRLIAVGNSASPGTSVSGVTNTVEFDGIQTIFTADAAFSAQSLDKADAALTLDMLDEMLDTIKVGKASWIMANSKGIRKITSLLRALGGVEYREIAGQQIMSYNGVPLIRNDFLPADVDGVTAGAQVDIYAGSFDDGSRQGGAAGIITLNPSFVDVTSGGLMEGTNAEFWRVVMYAGFAIHSPLAVARLQSVTV